MTLSLETDLSVADHLETVTLLARDGSEVAEIAGALRRAVTTTEAAASNGLYLAGDVRWHLPAAALAESPALGTRLRDGASAEWTVLSVERAALDTRWACTTRNLALAGGMTEQVTIQRATVAKGEHGEPRLAWSDWRTGVAARVQPQAAEVTVEHERRMVRVTHVAYLAEPLELSALHRVVRGEETFAVLRLRQAERIDQLTEVDLAQTPWPIDVADGGDAR